MIHQKSWSQVTGVAENDWSDASAEEWFSNETRQAFQRMHFDLTMNIDVAQLNSEYYFRTFYCNMI